MKRATASTVYIVGSWLTLRAAVIGLTQSDIPMSLGWAMTALAGWWLTCGIGIRLGMEPHEFIGGIVSSLGLRRPARSEDHDATL